MRSAHPASGLVISLLLAIELLVAAACSCTGNARANKLGDLPTVDAADEQLPENHTRTPEMFGAKGDGTTDDTDAFVKLFEEGGNVLFSHGATYLLNSEGQNRTIVLKAGTSVDFNSATVISHYKHAFRNFDCLT